MTLSFPKSHMSTKRTEPGTRLQQGNGPGSMLSDFAYVGAFLYCNIRAMAARLFELIRNILTGDWKGYKFLCCSSVPCYLLCYERLNDSTRIWRGFTPSILYIFSFASDWYETSKKSSRHLRLPDNTDSKIPCRDAGRYAVEYTLKRQNGRLPLHCWAHLMSAWRQSFSWGLVIL